MKTYLRAPLRRIAALTTAAWVMALAAACGSGSGSEQQGRGAIPETVTIGSGQTVKSLDPDRAIEVAELNVNHLIYGTLTELTSDGSEVIPGLADRWEFSDDKLQIIFTLKEGLQFSDGTPLTAEDVAASFERFMTDDANVNAGVLAPIKSVTATDAMTAVFELKSTYPSLITILATPAVPILPADRVNDTAFYKNPVSAGPYKLESYGSGEDVVLARNDLYVGAKPVVEKLRLLTIPDASARVSQLKAGQIDLAHDIGATLGEQLSGDVRAVYGEQFQGIFLYMNNRVAPLNDVRVRRAISLAADREQMSEVAFSGKTEPLGDIYPTTMQWHETVLDVSRNVDEAKELLDGTACEDGCTINMMLRNGRESYQKPGVVLKENLSEIGIDLQIEQVDNSVAAAREYEGNYELEVGGLYDYVDIPDGFLIYGLQSDGGIFALYSGYENAEMDAAIETAIGSDGEAREEAVATVHEIFERDVPFVPLVDYMHVLGTRLAEDYVFVAPSSFFEVVRE